MYLKRRCGQALPGVAPSCVTVSVDPRAHHRSPSPMIPWITQCAPSVLSAMAECPSMEYQSIDRVWLSELCYALGSTQGNVMHAWLKSLLGAGSWFTVPSGSVACVPRYVSAFLLFGMCLPEMMEPSRVKDTATPEVKFLDRCLVHSGEGVLPACVRRSRMRVWGAKMIRHRRSPATVNCASQATAGQPI